MASINKTGMYAFMKLANLNGWQNKFFLMTLLIFLSASGTAFSASATTNTLENINVSNLSNNRVQIELVLSRPTSEPLSFTIDNPARIALDFPDTHSNLKRKKKKINSGVVRYVHAVESKGRTRVVINLSEMVPYETSVRDNRAYITLGGKTGSVTTTHTIAPHLSNSSGTALTASIHENTIRNIDFHRGTSGEGRVTVFLSSKKTPVNMQKKGNKLVIDFIGTEVPKKLEQRLDVIDFATPVHTIDTRQQGSNVQMHISTQSNSEYLAYQSDDIFTIEVMPMTQEQQEMAEKREAKYSGEKLDLNFQDIEIRSVLDIIAEFSGLNIVAADAVKGNITLRLKNVPWDQALEIILKSHGLAMRENGNVIMIAPSSEVIAQEKQELEAKKQAEEVTALQSELIQVNYAKAQDMADLIKGKESALLSPRGSVSVDIRTNTLLVLDTPEKLTELRRLISQLDIPVRQVLIESRIVIASDGFSKDLGIRFGATGTRQQGGTVFATTASANGTNTIVNSATTNLQTSSSPFPVALPGLSDRLNVNLPVTAPTGQIALAILGSDYLLDLELSAMQAENRGEVVSSPRVITSNQREATIEQGTEIPYITPASGASNVPAVAFKKAVLSLKVTPQVTPDDRVLLDITVNKDRVGQMFQGIPSIDTKEVTTQVLIENGDTVVLGGVYEQVKRNDKSQVPLLGDIPYLGALFRRTQRVDTKDELLIFVTPKILKESYSLQ